MARLNTNLYSSRCRALLFIDIDTNETSKKMRVLKLFGTYYQYL